MDILGFFRGSASVTDKERVRIPYVELQKYFQLFAQNVTRNTPQIDPSVAIPGRIFAAHHVLESHLFTDGESIAETASHVANTHGGHIFAGCLVTHGRNGGTLEYLYIILAQEKPTSVSDHKIFDPYFAFIGNCLPGEQQELVEPVYVYSKSDMDDEGVFGVKADIDKPADIISALAYADPVIRGIYADVPLDAAELVKDFLELDLAVRFGKWRWLAENRTPPSFADEIADLRATPTLSPLLR